MLDDICLMYFMQLYYVQGLLKHDLLPPLTRNRLSEKQYHLRLLKECIRTVYVHRLSSYRLVAPLLDMRKLMLPVAPEIDQGPRTQITARGFAAQNRTLGQ